MREQLCDKGLFIVDAFVPDATIRHGEEVLDYSRLLPSGNFLVRSKVVQWTGEFQVNIIRRHYRILSSGGETLQRFTTAEHIRYFYPQQLKALVESCGFAVVRTDWDYGTTPAESPARFIALCCRVSRNFQGAQSFAC